MPRGGGEERSARRPRHHHAAWFAALCPLFTHTAGLGPTFHALRSATGNPASRTICMPLGPAPSGCTFGIVPSGSSEGATVSAPHRPSSQGTAGHSRALGTWSPLDKAVLADLVREIAPGARTISANPRPPRVAIAVRTFMDPSMAPIPQRLPDEGAPLAEYPSLGSRLWVDRLRLLGMMVFFAQLTETEATHHIPCPLNACHCSSLSSFFSGLVCPPCENSPPHIHAGWSLEVGTTPTERFSPTYVAVVRRPRVVPPRLVHVHRTAATRAHAVRYGSGSGPSTPSLAGAGTQPLLRLSSCLRARRGLARATAH